jgi:hypothetical protein
MNYLSFDKRALALMRICVAAVIMLDLAIRLTDLEAFYSDSGIAPLHMIFQNVWNPWFISIHTMSGRWQVELVLFLFAFFCAVMLFLGYRTRLFTFLSWFLMLSMHNRNCLILQGGDDLLRMVLFWGMFLPWGERYSCDSRLDQPNVGNTRIRTVATIAYLLQVTYIYTGSALLKGTEWDTDFTAVYYAYSLDQIAYPTTRLFYHNPEALKIMTAAAYYFELLIPLLFFIPVKHAWFRTVGVFSIIIFHFHNSISLFIGLFPAIGIATVIGILPTQFMDKFDNWTARLKPKIAQSFTGFAMLVSQAIRWRRPRCVWPEWLLSTQTAVLVFLTVFVFDWNISNLTFVKSKLSDHLRVLGYGLRLDQNWGMFAPGVLKDDGWFVMEGVTENGERFNLQFPDQPLSFAKPANVLGTFKNDRWRKYSENLVLADHVFMRGYHCNYSRRIWNEAHPGRQIDTLRVHFMAEVTLPDYQYSPPKHYLLWECAK